MLTDLIGYLAGVVTAVCFLPQIIHTLQTRKADDVSLWMLLLTLTGVVLYQVYAGLLGLVPVLIMNGIFLILVLVELGLKLKFDRTPS